MRGHDRRFVDRFHSDWPAALEASRRGADIYDDWIRFKFVGTTLCTTVASTSPQFLSDGSADKVFLATPTSAI